MEWAMRESGHRVDSSDCQVTGTTANTLSQNKPAEVAGSPEQQRQGAGENRGLMEEAVSVLGGEGAEVSR